MQKKYIFALLIVVLLAAAGWIAYSRFRNGRNTIPPQYYSQTKPATKATGISHIVLIMEENKPEGSIIGNPAAPYINELANTYARASNYYAVTNPSLPNYLAVTSGSNDGITNDCNPPSAGCKVNVKNIADEIEASGRTWKEYAESMPGDCYAYNSGQYATKHNPFIYYSDIIDNAARCQKHVVPFSQLASDFAFVSTTPNFAFITPNLCNDMHNCTVATGDNWLATNVPKILSSPAFTKQKSLLVITWDEGNAANNNVPAIFAGSAAKRGYVSSTYFSHYSLLHTIENVWNLQSLTTGDKNAPIMSDML